MYCIQFQSDWDDYPTWYNFTAGVDTSLIFETPEEAKEFLEEYLDKDLRRRQELFGEAYVEWLPLKELYEKRKQALMDAGLWKTEEESFSPLVAPGMRYNSPEHLRRHDENWRVAEYDPEDDL